MEPVQPNVLLFSQLVNIGEWAVGLLLLFGLLTRLGAIVGLWLNLNYMLMKGLLNNAGSNDRLFMLADLAFILGAAGLAWGLDGAWRRQLGGYPVTRWLAGRPEPEKAGERPGRVPVAPVQPPMADIGRSGRRKPALLMAWPGPLPVTEARQAASLVRVSYAPKRGFVSPAFPSS